MAGSKAIGSCGNSRANVKRQMMQRQIQITKALVFYIKTTKLPDHPVHFCRTIREFIFISSYNCYGTMRRKTGIFRRSIVVSIDSASASTVAEMT